ncbi:MAG TPA: signal peptidase I [Planctomycetes bacterium]|nr:signal peptidase I [Planctomycetota bacterium]
MALMDPSPEPREEFTGDARPDTPDAPAAAPQSCSLRKELVALALLSLVAVAIALVLRLYVAQAYEIRGRSMLPTYHDGDKVLLLKLAPSLLPIARDDIVIFTHPGHPDRDLVKRVVGVAGDRIHIDARGDLYVNGVRTESFNLASRQGRTRSRNWLVPEDSFFVLGDNRANSQDSRDFGSIPVELLRGKVLFRWWPLGSHADDPPGE